MQYFKSENIKVFPCAYRGVDTNNAEINQYARVPVEYNLTRPNVAFNTVDSNNKNSYIISNINPTTGAEGVLEVVIGGYYFYITYTASLDNKTLFINASHDGIDSEIQAAVLTSFEADNKLQLDRNMESTFVFDGTEESVQAVCFTGLAIIADSEDDPDYTAKLTINSANKFPISYDNIRSNNTTKAISGHVTDGDNYTAVDQTFRVEAKNGTATHTTAISYNGISTEGNLTVSGNATVTGTLTTCAEKFKVDSSGNVTAEGNLAAKNFKVTNGNITAVGSTLTLKDTESTIVPAFKVDNNNVTVKGTITAISGKFEVKSGDSSQIVLNSTGENKLILGGGEGGGHSGAIDVYGTGTGTVFTVNGSGAVTTNTVTTNTVTANSYHTTSDIRKKENVTEFETEKSILDLSVKRFDYIDGPKNQIGCIAQDLQEICPELVTEDEEGYLSIQESKLVYLLLNEVKKLKEEIDELKK